MKKKLGIVSRVEQSAPLQKKVQHERARRGCEKIYKQLVNSDGGKFIIIDDETYVPH